MHFLKPTKLTFTILISWFFVIAISIVGVFVINSPDHPSSEIISVILFITSYLLLLFPALFLDRIGIKAIAHNDIFSSLTLTGFIFVLITFYVYSSIISYFIKDERKRYLTQKFLPISVLLYFLIYLAVYIYRYIF